MAPSRKRAGQSVWAAIDDEDDNTFPQIVNFTHTELNLNEFGSSSIRTSHLATLASPSKKGKHTEQDTGTWFTEHQPTLPDFGDDLDPAYTKEQFEHQLEPPVRKKKISGVRIFFSFFFLKSYHLAG